MTSIPSPTERRKLFFIGFNKCGTTSLHRLMSRSGYSSVHWELPGGRFIAPTLFWNHQLGRPLLTGMERHDTFSDMYYQTEACCLEGNFLFRELHRQYPRALFVLNTRDREKWIQSRIRHAPASNGGQLVKRVQKMLGTSEESVLQAWRDQWDAHHTAVTDYFRDFPDQLFRFHLEEDKIEPLAEWVGDHGRPVDLEQWRRHNTTVTGKKKGQRGKA